MKKLLIATLMITLVSTLIGCAAPEGTIIPSVTGFEHRMPDDSITDTDTALERLVRGNERFISNRLMPRNTNRVDLNITAAGQWPFAVILTCSDSRVAPEIYFDQKIGDLFVIRNAGNFADETALGSLEFAVEHLGARLIVVVGHTMCGAVYTAHAQATGLSENLQNVISTVGRNIPNSSTPEEAVLENTLTVAAQVLQNEVVKTFGAVVLGAVYNIETGQVEFFEIIPEVTTPVVR
jgi:carbonic anhydrase